MLNSINSDLIRGHIDTIILSVLREGDRYGYDILGEIEKKSGGQYTLKQPTLYSCLKRLETQGFIYKYWGTESGGGRRTYYSLTEMGKELFLKNKDEWEHSRGIIDMLISSAGSPVRPYILVPEGKEAPANALTEDEESEEAASEPAEANSSTESETDSEEDAADAALAADETPADENASAENGATIAEEEAETAAETDDRDELSERIFDGILAEEESSRILGETKTSDETTSEDKLLGVSYADRLTDEPAPTVSEQRHSDELYEGVYSTSDYFKDYDGEDETYEGEEIEILDEPEAPYDPADASDENAAYADADTSAAETESENAADIGMTEYYSSDGSYVSEYYTDETAGAVQEEATVAADNADTVHTAETNTDNYSEEDGDRDAAAEETFRSYDDGELSEDARREMIIQRGYRGVIRDLLRGEYTGNITPPLSDEPYAPAEYEHIESAASEAETQPAARGRSTEMQADFSNLLTAVRSMGDEIRIRTHSSSADKEYNSVYQYYSNKLLLYKYGILFLLMAAEILIPYLIIKFAVGIEIRYEILTLVLSITGAAILPIYAVIANLIDPYKRKRYDFSMKNSVLFRLAVMVLMLVLIYAANVVLFMDISFDAEYAFSLITPALMSTNIPLSPVIFQTLYDTKKFNVEG